MLPQHDPEYNLLLLKSYNVPELTRSAVRVSIEELNHVVRHTEAELATFQGPVPEPLSGRGKASGQ